MTWRCRRARWARRVRSACVATALCTSPAAANAQVAAGERHLERLAATPVGALAPLAMPMPASRNHNYWMFRAQTAAARLRVSDDRHLRSIAGGVDFQWRGGSIAGFTAGRRAARCDATVPLCDDRIFFGARARVGVLTGGPTVAGMIGDYSASTTIGGELGIGISPAPRGRPGSAACALDIGMPITIAMFQAVRIVTFVSPGVAWDVGCFRSGPPVGASAMAAFGMSAQQLMLAGLDVHIGVQRVFRPGAGRQLGIGATYVLLR